MIEQAIGNGDRHDSLLHWSSVFGPIEVSQVMAVLCAMQITYSSDYFTELYQFAVQLIKRGCAYVDHQTADEIKLYR